MMDIPACSLDLEGVCIDCCEDDMASVSSIGSSSLYSSDDDDESYNGRWGDGKALTVNKKHGGATRHGRSRSLSDVPPELFSLEQTPAVVGISTTRKTDSMPKFPRPSYSDIHKMSDTKIDRRKQLSKAKRRVKTRRVKSHEEKGSAPDMDRLTSKITTPRSDSKKNLARAARRRCSRDSLVLTDTAPPRLDRWHSTSTSTTSFSSSRWNSSGRSLLANSSQEGGMNRIPSTAAVIRPTRKASNGNLLELESDTHQKGKKTNARWFSNATKDSMRAQCLRNLVETPLINEACNKVSTASASSKFAAASNVKPKLFDRFTSDMFEYAVHARVSNNLSTTAA